MHPPFIDHQKIDALHTKFDNCTIKSASLLLPDCGVQTKLVENRGSH